MRIDQIIRTLERLAAQRDSALSEQDRADLRDASRILDGKVRITGAGLRSIAGL